MKLMPFCLSRSEEISECLQNFRQSCPAKYRSVLVWIFTSDDRHDMIKKMCNRIKSELPEAVIAGCTSSGEIYKGHLELEKIIVTFMLFDSSEAEVLFLDCHERTLEEAGQEIMMRVDRLNDLAGVCIIGTLRTVGSVRDLNDKLKKIPQVIPVFGGSSDSYDKSSGYVSTEHAYIFSSNEITEKGVLVILFRGKDLHITVRSYHGWKPLGSASAVTDVRQQSHILTINDRPAVETYEKYLGISPGANFFSSIMSFPFIIERDGHEIARMPIGYHDDGSMTFGGDLYMDESVRLGYGDPNSMVAEATDARDELAAFSPEGIILFSCIVRRMYLHNDVNMELPLYEDLAPSVGFYTYGELQRFRGYPRIHLLNGALIAVGFREGPVPLENCAAPELKVTEAIFKDERISLIKGLANFVTVMAKELSEANEKLRHLADSDRLTELLNRGAIEQLFRKELDKLNDVGGIMSAIMLDIDHFKRINDNHGHEIGDQVLKQLAAILRDQVRSGDHVGRWGGEEFVIILPGCSILQAVAVAERIRVKLPSQVILPDGTRVTASFGVTGAKAGDSLDDVYRTLDKQLYYSKEHGRNKVTVAVSHNR